MNSLQQQLADAFIADWTCTKEHDFRIENACHRMTLQNRVIHEKYLNQKRWQDSYWYWRSVVTNIIMWRGSMDVLYNSIKKHEEDYKTIFDFDKLSTLNELDAIDLLKKTIPNGAVKFPGDQSVKSEMFLIDNEEKPNAKAAIIYLALEQIKRFSTDKPLEKFFMLGENKHLDYNAIRKYFNSDDRNLYGISDKQIMNIYMDVYHPAFRNNCIPIDRNWEKLKQILALDGTYNSKLSGILSWRNDYIPRSIINEDWEFDRLYFNSLKMPCSNISKCLREILSE